MMKIFSKTLLAVATVLSLANCNKSSDSSGDGGKTATTPLSSCPAGQISHPQYGCLAQQGCLPGQGLYNGACISIPATNTTVVTCPAGQIQNPLYGCLQQGNCQVGYGAYGGSCFPPPATSGYSCQGSCPAGQVTTMYGCLPQCGACGGMINGACIPGYSTTSGYYGYPYSIDGGVGFYWYTPVQQGGWWFKGQRFGGSRHHRMNDVSNR